VARSLIENPDRGGLEHFEKNEMAVFDGVFLNAGIARNAGNGLEYGALRALSQFVGQTPCDRGQAQSA